MNRQDLTQKQQRIVEAFQRRASLGLPPLTYRELCREFGWDSTGTARDHIRALVRKGVLSSAERRSRSSCLTSGTGGKVLPLIGRIVAGRPILSDGYVEKDVFVPDEFIPRGKTFVLRVNGDSMNGIGIFGGDLVVVRQARTAVSRDVVAITIDGESTLKILVEQSGRWFLVAANERYAPIAIDTPAVIHGVVTGVMGRVNATSARITPWVRILNKRERR